jgi:hypothetical protein
MLPSLKFYTGYPERASASAQWSTNTSGLTLSNSWSEVLASDSSREFTTIFAGSWCHSGDTRLWRTAQGHRRSIQWGAHRSCHSYLSQRLSLSVIIPGYHATTPQTFAAAIHSVLTLSRVEDLALRQRARTWAVQKFSVEEFERGWNASGWHKWIDEAPF